MAWPIDDPALIERLTLSDSAFRAMVADFMAAFDLPPYDDGFYERAVAYPWSRPMGSYALDGETELPLNPRSAEAVGSDLAVRVPLLAIGSNGAPSTLVRKFAHLPEEERRLLVVAGHLHGYDVGPAARITPYGALPATPFASAGTAVRSSVLWVTPAQLTALAWTELSYFVGWLGPVDLEPDEPEHVTGTPAVTQVLVYASRWGTLTDGSAPLALEALPARGRSAAARTQIDLLDELAAVALGPGADGPTLLRRLVGEPALFMRELEPWMAQRSEPFACAAWHPFPLEPPTTHHNS